MDDTAPAAAADPAGLAAPALEDPLAANDPNPAYLAALAHALDLSDEASVPGLARAASPAGHGLHRSESHPPLGDRVPAATPGCHPGGSRGP